MCYSLYIILPEVRQHLLDLAEQNNIPIVDLMGPMMDTFSKIIDIEPHLKPGWYIELMKIISKDGGYRFAVQYDDGKDIEV